MDGYTLTQRMKAWAFDIRCRCAKPAWWRQYRQVMANEQLSPDALKAFNFKLRLELLTFAYQNSPYYNKLYRNAGLEPGDIKTEEDWAKVPILTREALRFSFDEIKVRNLQPGSYNLWTTGGSTGEPSKVLKDKSFASAPLNWRALSWQEVLKGQNHATILRPHPTTLKGRIRHFLASFPSEHIMLDAGNMTDERITVFLNQWRRTKPVSVSAYVGGIHQLALYCMEHKIEVPAPMAISTTAAPLGSVQRNDIMKAFHAPVFDTYVATEAHPMAGQCRVQAEAGLGALHIHSDYRHLEFVNDANQPVPCGEEGDILVTDCGDRIFPIVRYKLGDRGHMLRERCPCGRPFPLMAPVKGRSFDFIYLEHGRIAGECWATAFDSCLNAVHNFQIHQRADKSVDLRVVLNRDYPEADRCVRQVASELQRQLGVIPLSLQYVDMLSHDRGKIKYIISDIREQKK